MGLGHQERRLKRAIELNPDSGDGQDTVHHYLPIMGHRR